MRISPLNQIQRIESAVKLAEKKFTHQDRVRVLPSGWRAFSTAAPRSAAYQATPTFLLLSKLDAMKLPREYHLADLGSGLGLACFTASLYFERVTGFELDPALLRAAENVRAELGIKNVAFKNQDFLEADLSPFNALYIFQPFLDGFIQLFSQKLLELKPGTIVLANLFDVAQPRIFNPAAFKLIHGRREGAASPLALDCIYAFQRR